MIIYRQKKTKLTIKTNILIKNENIKENFQCFLFEWTNKGNTILWSSEYIRPTQIKDQGWGKVRNLIKDQTVITGLKRNLSFK